MTGDLPKICSWTNRAHGESKLRLNEMGSRYAFIVLYVWLEHHLSRGDYRRADRPLDSGVAKPAPASVVVDDEA